MLAAAAEPDTEDDVDDEDAPTTTSAVVCGRICNTGSTNGGNGAGETTASTPSRPTTVDGSAVKEARESVISVADSEGAERVEIWDAATVATVVTDSSAVVVILVVAAAISVTAGVAYVALEVDTTKESSDTSDGT